MRSPAQLAEANFPPLWGALAQANKCGEQRGPKSRELLITRTLLRPSVSWEISAYLTLFPVLWGAIKSLSPGVHPFLFTLQSLPCYSLGKWLQCIIDLLHLLFPDLEHMSLLGPWVLTYSMESLCTDSTGETRLCLLSSLLERCHMPGDRLLRKHSQKQGHGIPLLL